MVNCQIMLFAGTALPMMAASSSWWESLPGRTFGPIFRSNCGLWSVSMLSQVLSNRVSFACFVVRFRCHWPTRWTVWAFLTLLFNLYDLHFGSIKGAYHSGVHWRWHLGISMTDVAIGRSRSFLSIFFSIFRNFPWKKYAHGSLSIRDQFGSSDCVFCIHHYSFELLMLPEIQPMVYHKVSDFARACR